ERIKEDALFSYAKLTYELSYSPFNETIKAFDRYISLYPNSQRNTEAYRYLTEVFMVTRNYRDAISSIEKIEVKTSEILRAYQRVTFYRGLELFNNLSYNQAIDHFNQSLQNGSYDRELNARALYWKAEALYRVSEYRSSAEAYSQFLRTAGAFSLPEYKDAEYNLAYAYFKLENFNQYAEATRNYRRIVDNHAESAYFPRTLLQLGLINFNNGEFNQALTYYKQVAEKFSGTPEAQAALLGIKNSYVEMNNVDGYFAYTRTLGGGVNVTTSEQDSLTYMAAERLYMSGDAQASVQLQRYLQQFPKGSFATNAHFYLAEILYKEGSFSQANEHYTFVARQPNNIFSEQALSRASELTFNAGDYENALEFFNRLEKIAGSKWNLLKAYTGQMRCNFQLKRYNEAILASEKVKKSDVANEAWIREANFVSGKSNYLAGNQNAALESLKSVATDTKLEQGAEAKFLVSEILYKQNQKQQAEEEIMDFIWLKLRDVNKPISNVPKTALFS
ncbi:MAG: tetratricopeptide repeat protein, partial [Bacteroidales bacterium]|nr:tetratricopeptide repeat protein [Bacteroidales bacterium]